MRVPPGWGRTVVARTQAEEHMGDEKNYKVGESVPENGKYVCEICHTEGGVDAHEFHEGEEFPVCMNCGHATSWKKASKKE